MMNKLVLKPSVIGAQILEAVLLNTNLRSLIPREAIVPASLQRYQACVAAGEATINLPSGEYRLTMDLNDGNALLHIWREQQLMSVACVATSPIGASDLWQFLLDLRPEQAGFPELEPPRNLPWLALELSPEFVASADVRMFCQFSALHWVLGWAVIEHTLMQHRRN